MLRAQSLAGGGGPSLSADRPRHRGLVAWVEVISRRGVGLITRHRLVGKRTCRYARFSDQRERD